YMNRIFWHTGQVDVSPDDIPQWAIKITAVTAVLMVTLLCVWTRKLGPRVAVVFTTVKVAALLAITILGIIQLARGKASESFRQPWFDGSSTSPSAYSLALYSGLWALDGWDQANYVGGEMKNAEKNNTSGDTLEYGIGPILDKVKTASNVFAFMVAISCFVYAAGRENYLPAFFGRLHKTRKTPLNATLLQTGITCTFILIGGGFRSLINFSVVASPYKTWIITPLTFCAVALFLLVMPIIAAPLEAVAVLGFVLAGVPVYYITHRSDQDAPRIICNMVLDLDFEVARATITQRRLGGCGH
ncbi:hypothetical protein MPER_09315, partial [Moniliophthora perniciosa FA553]